MYLQAAIRGDSDAISEVAKCYYYGIGTRKNRKIAEIWYDRAEELGSIRTD
ncbi:sel1 repeat family protein [Acinetobacter tjernbergiae]|uniref:sel1 repeat family protein n=1 Tax=Acinetobacter tjernbergiae TaxID=202955 RepID=UPI0012B5F8EB|nr:sel1 repeat family protein [Acinetobacter tjernbergiae]